MDDTVERVASTFDVAVGKGVVIEVGRDARNASGNGVE
jgi:hypothetical protein